LYSFSYAGLENSSFVFSDTILDGCRV